MKLSQSVKTTYSSISKEEERRGEAERWSGGGVERWSGGEADLLSGVVDKDGLV